MSRSAWSYNASLSGVASHASCHPEESRAACGRDDEGSAPSFRAAPRPSIVLDLRLRPESSAAGRAAERRGEFREQIPRDDKGLRARPSRRTRVVGLDGSLNRLFICVYTSRMVKKNLHINRSPSRNLIKNIPLKLVYFHS